MMNLTKVYSRIWLMVLLMELDILPMEDIHPLEDIPHLEGIPHLEDILHLMAIHPKDIPRHTVTPRLVTLLVHILDPLLHTIQGTV